MGERHICISKSPKETCFYASHSSEFKNSSVFLGVFISETQKLHLQRIELNSHIFSEHVLVRLLFNFNAKKIHTFVNL